ncbi:MAG: hypothetical protein AAF718_06495 [Pseudomonadota bacterium]
MPVSVTQPSSKTVADIANANQDAYEREAFGGGGGWGSPSPSRSEPSTTQRSDSQSRMQSTGQTASNRVSSSPSVRSPDDAINDVRNSRSSPSPSRSSPPANRDDDNDNDNRPTFTVSRPSGPDDGFRGSAAPEVRSPDDAINDVRNQQNRQTLNDIANANQDAYEREAFGGSRTQQQPRLRSPDDVIAELRNRAANNDGGTGPGPGATGRNPGDNNRITGGTGEGRPEIRSPDDVIAEQRQRIPGEPTAQTPPAPVVPTPPIQAGLGGSLVDRIEAMAERLSAIMERMASVLGQLAERLEQAADVPRAANGNVMSTLTIDGQAELADRFPIEERTARERTRGAGLSAGARLASRLLGAIGLILTPDRIGGRVDIPLGDNLRVTGESSEMSRSLQVLENGVWRNLDAEVRIGPDGTLLIDREALEQQLGGGLPPDLEELLGRPETFPGLTEDERNLGRNEGLTPVPLPPFVEEFPAEDDLDLPNDTGGAPPVVENEPLITLPPEDVGPDVVMQDNFGRTEEELQALAEDPAHGGRITQGSIAEREAGLGAEASGSLPGPITRDPSGASEFFDSTGQAWDVKGFRSDFPPERGGFTEERALASIERELQAGHNVIIDTRNLSAAHLEDLRRSVENAGHEDRVVYWPD